MTATTLHCTTTRGDVLATVTLSTSSFASTALSAATCGLRSGVSAERFARWTFAALAEYEGRRDLRSRLVLQHLRTMDRLALTAVGHGIRATITWD